MNRKLLLILILAVFLLGGAGGGAAWWFFLREPAAGEGALAQAPPDIKVFEFDPLVLPLIREGRVTRHVTMMLILQIDQELGEQKVLQAMPRLKDAYVTELHSLLSMRFMQEREDALEVVRERLMAATERVLGPGIVLNIYFNSANPVKPSDA